MRTSVLVLVGYCLFTLAACGDDDSVDSGGAKQDSGAKGGGGGHHTAGSGGHAASDAAAGGGGGSGGHTGSGSGGHTASDSGAGGGASHDAGHLHDSGVHDAGAKDSGSDSGADSGSGGTGAGSGGTGSGSGGTGSGGSSACDVPCGSDCCTTSEQCGTEPPKTANAGWGFGAGTSVLHVVQGSTVTFNAGTAHNVYQFPNASDYASCTFTSATELAASGTYNFIATTLGDFYFGCSKPNHCASNNVKKHVVVEAPGPACVPK